MASVPDVKHIQVQSDNAHNPSRRKNKSREDPFLQLPITPSLTSPVGTPGEKAEDTLNSEDKIDRQESILVKVGVISFGLFLYLR